MPDPVRHVYSTVRVVPNPATGEFANLAAIAGSDLTGEWTIRSIQNERRARVFCGHHALVAGHDFVSRIGMLIDLEAWNDDDFELQADTRTDDLEGHVSEAWLAQIAATNRHVVQLSPPHPILAESAEDALDVIFANMLPEPLRRRRSLTKWALVSSMSTSFSAVGLQPKYDFERRVAFNASGPQRFHHTIDFAVADSHARQLVQAWSFQISEQSDLSRDVKAWGWTMRELREHGGEVSMHGRKVAVPADVPIEVVIAPPTDDAGSAEQDRYGEALNVFDELEVSVTEHGQEAAIADRAADLMGRFGEDGHL